MMENKKVKFKFFRALFKPTALDKRFPTDRALDTRMSVATWYLHELEKETRYIIKRKIALLFKYKWYQLLIIMAVIASTSIGANKAYRAWIRPTLVKYIINEKVSNIEKSFNDHPIPQGNIDFMIGIRQLEGSNDYKVVRSWIGVVKGKKTTIYSQYWGAYQEGDLCRKAVGLADMSMKDFLNDKNIQDWAMNRYMNLNYKALYSYIDKHHIPIYGGIKIGNDLVTISGLIAASHLVGPTAVILYLETNGKTVTCDGNGTPLTKYLQLNNLKLQFD